MAVGGPGGAWGGSQPKRSALVVVVGLVLIVGGCLMWPSGSEPPNKPEQAGASGTTTTTPPVSVPPPPPAEAVWTGRIRVPDGLDFSTGVPKQTRGTGTINWTDHQERLSLDPYSAMGAPWGGDGTPSYAECIAALQQQPLGHDEDDDLPWRDGQGYCVEEREEAIVFFRVAEREGEALWVEGQSWKYQQPKN